MKVILIVPDESYSDRTWWKLFQKRVVHTKFDIYVFINVRHFHEWVFMVICKYNIAANV